MSRQNKVNPGMYTQRGRLTQDDAARELRKQREVGSQHTWQPVKKDQLPRFESNQEKSGEGTETSGDTQGQQAAASPSNVQPTKRVMKTAAKSPAKAKAKAAKPKAARTSARRTATKTSARGKTGKAAKSATKATVKKAPKRQAVLARNVGGGGPKPRRATKRRKS